MTRSEFRSLTYQNTLILSELRELKKIVLANKQDLPQTARIENLERKYNISLPFRDLEAFQSFDGRLEDDELFRQDVVNVFFFF